MQTFAFRFRNECARLSVLIDNDRPEFHKNYIGLCKRSDCFVKHQAVIASCGWLQPGRNILLLTYVLCSYCSILARETAGLFFC